MTEVTVQMDEQVLVAVRCSSDEFVSGLGDWQ